MHTPPIRLWFRISFRTTMLVVVTALTAGFASSAELPKEITNSIGMRFKLIPAGEFLMGSSESPEEIARAFGVKPEWFDAQRPQHKVRITKPFYLGVTEVTQEQYECVMGKNPSYFSETGMGADEVKGMYTSNFPVEKVSWEDAVEFCKKLSAKEGETYRLPTEAEWEYACRAGCSGRHCFGDNTALLGDHAWFLENSDRTQPVGKKRPNSWGLYDMHGNVWEWCRDWYDEDYYAESPKDGPTGPSAGSDRVFRGGSWHYVARYCLSSFRRGHPPTYRSVSLGFRVARNPSVGQQSSQAAGEAESDSR